MEARAWALGLNNTSRVSDLDRGGDPSVEVRVRPSVPCLGSDPRGDAVEELPGRRTERAQCFQPDRAKKQVSYLNIK